MFQRVKVSCLLFSLVILLSTPFTASRAYGQGGTIQGTVLDPSGAVIRFQRSRRRQLGGIADAASRDCSMRACFAARR